MKRECKEMTPEYAEIDLYGQKNLHPFLKSKQCR